ncbi:electron transfer flavoprotein subunit beta/FixA family protein [Micromonospora harpali]|uniref:Electron transfer flavoprotein subunit beta n=2 Tax=Micromonospora TaxID=1873 RepID=A0A1C4TXP5_9ACTN|nr:MULTISPECIES: electron transfer flavoprotein subunit beta/FixA family protein [Micromonospora]MDI5938537.1 electron transfer flavoprotein subunit beta/FixA family protein [Micromonospora sp. DH15]OON31794.1 electron transfer flavoprotein subunit beta [Micromonospora sp. Rc5]SCE64208.1 electron transfer flavoprotein beta subunit [Micromonospora haikouensis]
MNIVVLVKQVPDSGADRNLRPDDNTVDRGSASNVINEMDEYAIEEALKIKEAHGGEVTILTMGPDRATESIRKALSMGPDAAVHVVDDALHGSCAVATSKVLAAALGQLNADLVICGAESTDGRVQVMPHMIAERLGVAALTGARKLTVDGSTLTVERQTEEGYEVVTASTPAVVSVWDTINEPRYPSFKGIMAAKKKPVRTLSLADLGVAPAEVGFDGATSTVLEHSKRPPRSGGAKVTDEGSGGAQLVEFLATEKFV